MSSQKLSLHQALQQKLSPQQIQFIKLLQVTTAELENRVEQELEINPALEEGEDKPDEEPQEYEENDTSSDIELDDYIQHDEYNSYKTNTESDDSEEATEFPIVATHSVHENLLQQVSLLHLDEHQETIAKQLVGSMESDGYIRRPLESIVYDLMFSQNVTTTVEEVESVLKSVQALEPPGICARNIQECLLLQLERLRLPDKATQDLAIKIIHDYFKEFSLKHFEKIMQRMNITEAQFKSVMELIMRLDPKPGGEAVSSSKFDYIIPDYILTHHQGRLELSLNSRNAPELRVSKEYINMFKAYQKSNKQDKKLKDTVLFVKQKLDSAKWFIEAIKQRQNTLLLTMQAILDYQYEYFLDGDETKLKPMILRYIADKIGMDVSTISRVVSSKYIQTKFGIFPLKYFFSEGIQTSTGEEVSSREVKQIIKDIVESESKSKPYSDERIESMLKEKGYNIARRTVAKYREQLDIPVARLRKEL